MVDRLPYDILKDFQPIALISRGHLLLAVAPTSEFKSVKELVDKGKQNPGKLTNASSANGSPGHVGGELFKNLSGIDVVHVPYRGGAAAINDLIAGRVDFMFESLNSISPHAKSGNVRALAVSGDRRSPAFPDLPTVAEAGVTGYSAPTWSGIIGPAGLPRDVLMKLNDALNRAVSTPAFKARFGQIGDEAAGGTPEEFSAMLKVELAKWKEVVQRSGAKMQ
jgi:tripartite-type tricarboxylate transporter receptor subunit TctC